MAIRGIELPRETLQNVQICEVHKLDLLPMLGAIGESWSNLIISVLHKDKFKSSHTSNLRDYYMQKPIQIRSIKYKVAG